MIEFTKMQGIGNDYVYIDAIHQEIEEIPDLAKVMSNRHYGIGSDGIILVEQSSIADFRMRIFNADGSEAEMCGNGIRCVGKFVYDKELTDKTKITIETLAGIKKLELNVKDGKVETVKVDMGEPVLEATKIPVVSENTLVKNLKLDVLDRKFVVTCVSMGNPHAVIIVDKLKDLEIEKYGREIEKNKIFPNRTNVEFVEIKNRKSIKMRVWERGVGETLACGTGACSATVACVLNDLVKRKVDVELLGGNLQIEWRKGDNHVYMTGAAVNVFEGEYI